MNKMREPHSLLVAADMSQLELRIGAYMSRDPIMLDIIRNGRDMHCVTAAAIYGVDEHRCSKSKPHSCPRPGVSDSMRKTSKVVNYESGYGGGPTKMVEIIEKMVLSEVGMGDELRIPSMSEAKEALATHKRLYAQYWQWVKWTITRIRINGFSETAFGRPRYFPLIDSPRDDDRTEAERAGVNHSIQGTAGDMMKMAQVNIARDSLMSSWGSMLLQIHDEIVSKVWYDKVELYEKRIDQHMQLSQPFAPYVELVVDVNSAFRWDECHK